MAAGGDTQLRTVEREPGQIAGSTVALARAVRLEIFSSSENIDYLWVIVR